MEINEISNKTQFKTFSRYHDFWVFGDESTKSDTGKVNVLAGDKVITLTTNQADAVSYGKNIWISSDKNTGEEENILVALSKMTSNDPAEGKIEFHRFVPTVTEGGEVSYSAYQL